MRKYQCSKEVKGVILHRTLVVFVALVMIGTTVASVPPLTGDSTLSNDSNDTQLTGNWMSSEGSIEIPTAVGEEEPAPLEWEHIDFIGMPGKATDAEDYFIAGYSNEFDLGDVNADGDIGTLIWMYDMVNDDLHVVYVITESAYPDVFVEYDFVVWHHEETVYVYRIFVTPKMMPYEVEGIHEIFDLEEEFVPFLAHEDDLGMDVNGDGDQDDWFVGHLDLRACPAAPVFIRTAYTGTVAGLDDASAIHPSSKRVFDGTRYAFLQGEQYDDTDYNGDGDTEDFVVAYYELEMPNGNAGPKVNLEVQGWDARVAGDLIAWHTSEEFDDQDWNDDGDKEDSVVLYHDIDADFIGLVSDRLDPDYGVFVTTEDVGGEEKGRIIWCAKPGKGKKVRPDKPGKSSEAALKKPHKIYFAKEEDEDGDEHTPLIRYTVEGMGKPVDAWRGAILIYSRNGSARLWILSDGAYAEPIDLCPWEWTFPQMGGESDTLLPIGTPASEAGYIQFSY
jgi:hypothetical protein